MVNSYFRYPSSTRVLDKILDGVLEQKKLDSHSPKHVRYLCFRIYVLYLSITVYYQQCVSDAVKSICFDISNVLTSLCSGSWIYRAVIVLFLSYYDASDRNESPTCACLAAEQ